GGFYDPSDLYSSQAYDWDALNAQGHCCNPFGAPDSPPEASIVIATAGGASSSDLKGFNSQYNLAGNRTIINIDGNPGCCNGEATLDIEWAAAAANSFASASDTAHIYVYMAPTNSNGGLPDHESLDMANQALSDGYARTYSTSWGAPESHYCSL